MMSVDAVRILLLFIYVYIPIHVHIHTLTITYIQTDTYLISYIVYAVSSSGFMEVN